MDLSDLGDSNNAAEPTHSSPASPNPTRRTDTDLALFRLASALSASSHTLTSLHAHRAPASFADRDAVQLLAGLGQLRSIKLEGCQGLTSSVVHRLAGMCGQGGALPHLRSITCLPMKREGAKSTGRAG